MATSKAHEGSPPAIGIDLGSTNSCVAVCVNDSVKTIKNDIGNTLTPTHVAFPDESAYKNTFYSHIVGTGVQSVANNNPKNAILDVKRIIGKRFDDPFLQEHIKSWPFESGEVDNVPFVTVGGNQYSIEHILAKIPAYLKKQADTELKCTVTDAVITVPAYFNAKQRQIMKDAGEIAGLNILGIINEPTAVVIAYNHRIQQQTEVDSDGTNDDKKVLIFDIDHEKFDLTLLVSKGPSIKVAAIDGDTDLGGNHFASILVDYCLQDFKKKHNIDLSEIQPNEESTGAFRVNKRLRRIRSECKTKIERYFNGARSIRILIDSVFEGEPININLTRKALESIYQPLFDKFVSIIDRILKNAGVTRDDVDRIILVGASSRISKIQEMVKIYFDGKQPMRSIKHDEVVAYGAAVYASTFKCGCTTYVDIEDDYLDVSPIQNIPTMTVLGDGSMGKIGSYVKVLAMEDEVSKLAGSAVEWNPGMADSCGRTGRIIKILHNSDVLVQFAWGARFYFKPDALLRSVSDQLETQDYKNNWIRVGSIVEITKPSEEYESIQKENDLLCDGNYEEPLGTFALVKEIHLDPFMVSKITVSYKETKRLVHAGCIELVDSVKDRNDMDLSAGCQVQVLGNADELKLEQEKLPGCVGWTGRMVEVVGKVGQVECVCFDEDSESDSLVVKVFFHEFVSYFFNPKALEVFNGTFVYMHAEKKLTVFEDKLEQIDRSSLKCFETLGEGGFGCVVRGEWLKNGVTKAVAIKQIKAGVTSWSGPLDEVLKDTKIPFSMKHPNIVSWFGISLETNLWIVMDLVDGNNLFNLLFPVGKDPVEFTMKQKLKFAADMSNAIAYIHQKRHLHCDIKPHNMIVDSRSEKLYVYNFGIKNILRTMGMMSFTTKTATQPSTNTTYYISPECLQQHALTGEYRKPTFAADIWALGAVFYELFVEDHLYEHHMLFLQHKLVNNDATIKRRLTKLPEDVRPIVSKSLNFDHRGRPHAQELYEFFHELFLKHENK